MLLKVNLIGPLPPESAAVTHPALVRAMIRLLKAMGCTVWVGDSSGGAIGGRAQTGKSLDVSGIARAAEEEGAVVQNFDREGVVEVSTASAANVSRQARLCADAVINMPKLKTHMAALYTGAVKNLFGCVPGLAKADYHRQAESAQEFGEVLCEINKHIRPALTVMDGVVAMDGQGPTSGRPYPAGKLLISADPLALDAVGAAMLGRDTACSPTLHRCATASARRTFPALRYAAITARRRGLPALTALTMVMERTPAGILGRIDLMRTRPEVDAKACRKCNVA